MLWWHVGWAWSCKAVRRTLRVLVQALLLHHRGRHVCWRHSLLGQDILCNWTRPGHWRAVLTKLAGTRLLELRLPRRRRSDGSDRSLPLAMRHGTAGRYGLLHIDGPHCR